MILSNAVLLGDGDVEALMEDVLPFGLAGTTPSRAELLRLTWWTQLYGQRRFRGGDAMELAAERAAILHYIRNYQPSDPEEENRIKVLELTFLTSDATGEDVMSFSPPEQMLDTHDPVLLFLLVRGMKDTSPMRQDLRDRLLRSDPANPRYSDFLLRAALAESDPIAAVHVLLRSGLPDPRFDEHAWVYLAALEEKTREGVSPGTRERLLGIENGPARRAVTEVAVLSLARDDRRHDRPDLALQRIDAFEERFGRPTLRTSVERSGVLAELGRPQEAALAMLQALRLGDLDHQHWYDAASLMQDAGRIPEAVRLYQFYLLQVDRRAQGLLPYGPPVDTKKRVRSHAKVWGRYAELQPSFVTRSAVRHLLELLAFTAAGMLAAARFRRARAFLLPAGLGAEVTFFAGLIALRAEEQAIGVVSILWLLSAAGRAFILVGGGLYLSASCGLPRRATAPRLALVAATLAAGAAGWLVGFPPGPLYLLADIPLAARVGELGLGAREAIEGPAVVVALVRTEAAARLVWPALAAGALHASASPVRATAAFALAAAVTATGSQLAWPLAFLAAGALVLARLKGGALAPFVLHAAFVAGGVAALAVRG